MKKKSSFAKSTIKTQKAVSFVTKASILKNTPVLAQIGRCVRFFTPYSLKCAIFRYLFEKNRTQRPFCANILDIFLKPLSVSALE